MKNFLFILFLIPSLVFSQSWEKVFADSEGHSVQQTNDGGYIVAGSKRPMPKVYLVKTNENGDTLWTKSIQGTGIGYSVKQTTDGGFIITGLYLEGTWVNDVYLIKTDHDGNTLWTKTYGGANPGCGYSVQQTIEGGYIIAGYQTDMVYLTEDVYLIKTDSNGDTLWTKKYGGSGNNRGYSVQQTSDGGYIIVGFQANNVYLIKTNEIGDTSWTKKYYGSSSSIGKGFSVKQTTDGGYIITGYTYTSGNESLEDIFLMKTNDNGDTLWTRTYGGDYRDSGESVEQTTDGGYIIAGWTRLEASGQSDVYLVKTDENGNSLWTRSFNTNDNDIGFSVQQTNDGGYIIAGYTDPPVGPFSLYLIKTNYEGNIVSTIDIPVQNPNRKLIKIVDLLGREIAKPDKNKPYIEIYDDETSQKKMNLK